MPRAHWVGVHRDVDERSLPVKTVWNGCRPSFGSGLVALLAWLAWGPRPAAGQGLATISPGAVEVGFELRGASSRVGAARHGREDQTGTWVSLPVSGSLLSPRLLTYSATLRPTWTTSVARAATSTRLRSNSLARDISGRLAPLSWLSLYLSESDMSVNSTGTFTVSESHVSSSGWGAQMGLAPVRLAAALTRRQVEEVWRNTRNDLVSRRDYTDRTLRLSGQSSKTDLTWERTFHRDRILGEAFEARTGSFVHQLAWGKGSSIGSSLQWDRRLDGTGWRQATWMEQARLQHARTFHSEWRYRRYRSRLDGTTGRGDAIGAGVGHEASPWLRWSVNSNLQVTQASGLRSDSRSVSPQVALTPPAPRPFQLTATARVSFEHERLQGDASTPTQVFGERHTVDATRAFLLDNAGVDSASVEVRDRTQTVLYDPRFDYELLPAGAFTQVRIPLGSRIQPGAEIVVNYRFRFPTRRSEDVVVGDGSVQLGFPSGWLRHRQTIRSRSSADDSPLSFAPGFNEAVTEIEVVRPTRAGSLRLDGVRRSRSLEASRFTSIAAGACLTSPAVHRMSSTLSVRWTGSRGDGRGVGIVDGTASLSWLASQTIRTGARLLANRTHWSDGDGERSLAGELQACWCVGKLNAEATYALQWRDTPTTQTLGRWTLRATRGF